MTSALASRESAPSVIVSDASNAVNELEWNFNEAVQAAADLTKAVTDFQQWMDQRQMRRKRTLILVGVLTVVIALTSVFGVRAFQTEQVYQAAVSAFSDGHWQSTRDYLGTLQTMQADYRDSRTLARESYYAPAVAALEERDWDLARRQLRELIAIDRGYKDAQTLLLESYYRPASDAIRNEDWTTAQSILRELISIDSNYRDTKALLSETYYQPAIRSVEEEDWESAQSLLTQLVSIDEQYKDSAAQLRLSYYRPALQAYQSGKWDLAMSLLEQLAMIDEDYEDAIELLKESYYQQAIQSLEQGEWSMARSLLAKLAMIDGNYKIDGVPEVVDIRVAERLVKAGTGYKDSGSMLIESYLREAMTAVSEKDWTTAASAIVILDQLSPNNGSVAQMIAENHDLGAAIREHRAQLWSEGKLVLEKKLQKTSLPWQLQFTADSQELILASRDANPARDRGTVTSIKTGSWHVLSEFPLEDRPVSMAVSEDGILLAIGNDDDHVGIWDRRTGAFDHWLPTNNAESVTFLQNTHDVVYYEFSRFRGFRVWDTSDRLVKGDLNTGDCLDSAFAISPDARFLATPACWVELGSELKQGKVSGGGYTSVAFSTDNRYVVSGYNETRYNTEDINDVVVTNITDHTKVRLQGHAGMVNTFSFLPVGHSIVASGSWDGSVRLWDILGERQIAVMNTGEKHVLDVAFSPDARWLAVASLSGVYIYSISPTGTRNPK